MGVYWFTGREYRDAYTGSWTMEPPGRVILTSPIDGSDFHYAMPSLFCRYGVDSHSRMTLPRPVRARHTRSRPRASSALRSAAATHQRQPSGGRTRMRLVAIVIGSVAVTWRTTRTTWSRTWSRVPLAPSSDRQASVRSPSRHRLSGRPAREGVDVLVMRGAGKMGAVGCRAEFQRLDAVVAAPRCRADFGMILALLLVAGPDAVPTTRQARLAMVHKARTALRVVSGW